jgi:terminal uridylyltransferase
LECDISLQNRLAVENSMLLRAYGSIDPRVRYLVFLIKHWAKARQMNSPSDGTLSSYGFILCVIHFLQVLFPFPCCWRGICISKTNKQLF